MKNKVIIIGGGIAGLSAGCYLRMNGYDTEIHEMHSLPGGLCTAWKRDGYTIDGCIHWLVGTNPDDAHYKIWNELVDMKSMRFVGDEVFYRLEGSDGRVINVYTDIDRLEAELLAKAPADSELIGEFIGAARRLGGFKLPTGKAPELYNIFDTAKLILRFIPYAGAFKKWMGITGGEFAARCKDPLLRKLFETLFLEEMAALFMVYMVIWMNKKSAGYPIGGSLEFARRIEKRYIDLGGKIHYRSKVVRIIVEGGAAKGVELEDGEDRGADIVISAADGNATIFDMLGGRFVDEKVKSYYRDYPVFPSWIQVSLGLKRTFEGCPGIIGYVLDEPLEIDNMTTRSTVGFRIFNFDPTMSPAGRTVVTSLIPTHDYEYWRWMREHEPQKYAEHKDRIAAAVIDTLERRMGNIRNNVEMVDVSTPASVIRYTNNWRGSLEGWVLGPKMGLKRMKKTLPGLENFYMAGQWVEPGGGVPTAAISGRNITQIICKKDGVKFVTKSF